MPLELAPFEWVQAPARQVHSLSVGRFVQASQQSNTLSPSQHAPWIQAEHKKAPWSLTEGAVKDLGRSECSLSRLRGGHQCFASNPNQHRCSYEGKHHCVGQPNERCSDNFGHISQELQHLLGCWQRYQCLA